MTQLSSGIGWVKAFPRVKFPVLRVNTNFRNRVWETKS